jgi:hypothetical protein
MSTCCDHADGIAEAAGRAGRGRWRRRVPHPAGVRVAFGAARRVVAGRPGAGPLLVPASRRASTVAAMGGTLRLVAEFPNRQPVAMALGDITGSAPFKAKRRARASK